MNLLDLTRATVPEIGLTVLALVVLLLDVTMMRAWEPRRRARALGAVAVAGLGAILAITLQHQAAAGASTTFVDPARIFVEDGLSSALRALIVILTAGTILIAIEYEFTRHIGESYAVLLFAAAGACFLVATENLLMFLVALELLSICLYILTALHRGVLRSAEGAVKYFMIGALSSAFLLFGLSYLVGLTGKTSFKDVAAVVATQAHGSSLLLFVGVTFVLVGLGFKIAAVPFHAWAPDAYEGAPTPVTAFIATVSKVASFVVGAKVLWIACAALKGDASWPWAAAMRLDVMKAHFVAGWAPIVALMAAASMIWGNVAAIAQTNVKRMLAYSSIAHAGYVLVAVVAGGVTGASSVLYYMVAYALANLGAFGVVAVITKQCGGDDLSDLDGLFRRAPGMALLLATFVLSLAGIPPLAGFFGKFYLFAAAVKADSEGLGLLWLVVLGIATSAVSLYYYLVLLKHALVDPARRDVRITVPPVQLVTLIATAVAVVVIGAFPEPVVRVFGDLAALRGLG